MKLSEYPGWTHSLYSMHECLRKLGFSADDIYVVIGNILGIGPAVYIELKTQEKTFVIPVVKRSDITSTNEEIYDEWNSFIKELTSSPEEEVQKVWQSTKAGANTFMFLLQLSATLAKRGFSVPNLPNSEKLAPLGEELGVGITNSIGGSA